MTMTIHMEYLAIALGIGLTAVGLVKYRSKNHKVKFSDLRYNPKSNELELHVYNIGSKGMFVQPALRLVRFTALEQLKGNSCPDRSSIPMMRAAAGSLIRGYDLIGESASPVQVGGNRKSVIRYELPGDMKLNFCDTIKVDSMVGSRPDMAGGFFSNTMKLTFMCQDERNIQSSFEANKISNGFSNIIDGGISLRPLLNPLDGCLISGGCLSRSLSAKEKGLETIEEPDQDDECCHIELVENPLVDLKPRHSKILDTLEGETTVTAKELAQMLKRKQKPVAQDLRYLMGHDLVDRVRIRGVYKYFVIRGQQIVINDGRDGSDMCT